jgi:hypothetical protein
MVSAHLTLFDFGARFRLRVPFRSPPPVLIIGFARKTLGQAIAFELSMNTSKLVLCLIAVASVQLPTASADTKQYRLTLRDAAVIGTQQLKAGDYKLLVDDTSSTVTLRHAESGDSFDLSARVENGERKFDRTAVHLESASGQRQVTRIDLGGTKTSVSFP